jgi:hypothetical protein
MSSVPIRVRRRTTPALLALTTLVLVGCGGGEMKTYPVHGTVVLPDGRPLPGGWITFQSVGGEKAVSADSEITEEGTFELRTFQPGDGAPAGKYQVSVRPPLRGEDESEKKPPLIDPKYHDPATSGLEYTVEPKSNEFTITVTPPPGRGPGHRGRAFDP